MKKILFSFALLAMIFASCTKDGPVGPTGPAGTNGTNGSNGNNGTNGNANVHTQNFTINSEWYHYGTAGQPDEGYQVDIPCSIITSDIVSAGAVLAYASGDNQMWMALPYTNPTGLSETYPYSSSVNYIYITNDISIFYQDNDFYTSNPGLTYIKVITIAGQTLNPKIDYENYSEVKEYYNLPN